MGAFNSKKKSKPCRERRNVKILTDKMRLLQEDIKEMVHERAKEAKGYEKQVMVFACKEVEWKKERKKLKDEVKKLKKLVEEKEEKIRGMENYAAAVEKCDKGWPLLGTSFLLEQMKEERARRDEAVEKWKQLYHAIRTELDDLIQRTHGDALYWKADEEEMIEELKKEVKSKEETIEALKTRVASMEREGYEREREMDILKQSLRILGVKNKATFTSNTKSITLPQYL
ncbi:structural maintenance of chromosomes protein 3-like [Durio zibethinus]|uniref:Structural maintenance of chromosomes protein 3-like n=1 Tax=Durio zibethinus TaxID=66656 RepID=A0A6P6A7Z9_DURZI|nr:structural maintenance of chromosomes protein 3-like [Durio zibethinus]